MASIESKAIDFLNQIQILAVNDIANLDIEAFQDKFDVGKCEICMTSR